MNKLIIYIVSVVMLNIMFATIPTIILPDGTLWSVGSILAGFVFVARDYAQREQGHKVIFGMVIAVVLSYYMANPFVAFASACSFFASEFIDWFIYTITKKPFNRRVVISSVISCPIDTIIFLWMIDQLSLISFSVMLLSKFISIFWAARYVK